MGSERKLDSDPGSSGKDELAERRTRMRFGWDDLIEELIQEGQDKGAFENLKGAGKPLDLRRNQYAPDWELAHSLMKENKVLPPWIEKRNRIVAKLELMRMDITRKWAKYLQAYALARGDAHRTALALEWHDICRQWDSELGELNKKIDDFNLSRPSDNLEIFRLELDSELERIGAKRDLSSVV